MLNFRAPLCLVRLVGLVILIRLIVLILDEVIEQTRPSLVVVVDRQVVADELAEVEEHVPRVPLDPPDGGMLMQEPDPSPQDGWLPLREDELPEQDGHLHRKRLETDGHLAREASPLCRHDRREAEPEGESVQVFEEVWKGARVISVLIILKVKLALSEKQSWSR